MSEAKEINIISFNIPYPPDYGGIIDVFYKIKTLHSLGVIIHLHCFEYGRPESKELENFCKSVTYYKRNKRFFYLFNKIPFIVLSRNNNNLFENIENSGLPVIFEGLHTSLYLHKEIKPEIKTMLRAHNVEHFYYKSLAFLEHLLWKKIYYWLESNKLKRYEPVVINSGCIAAISPGDFDYYNKMYGKTILIPAFHPYEKVESHVGTGKYILYQADLSIHENYLIAQIIIKIAPKFSLPLIIAGKNPNPALTRKIIEQNNVQLIANPSLVEMQELITNAHINILPGIQSNGVKLKLLAALYQGRHVVANDAMLKGSGLESLCHKAESDDEIVDKINSLISVPFHNSDILRREELLNQLYNNLVNAKMIINFFWQ